MKNIIIIAAFSITSLLMMSVSCVEHEVVPPPNNDIDLNAHFEAYVNGTQVEMTQNVSGYIGSASNTSIINASPIASQMVYSARMSSFQQTKAIEVKLGALNWDAAVDIEPTKSMFADFHNGSASANILFSDQALNGFEVRYTDDSGMEWVSMQNSNSAQNVTFSNISQASDNHGDYSRFECNFSCYVYKVDVQSGNVDSLQIQSGKFNGWFIR